VVNYLIENGISSQRLTFKGYGNSMMEVPEPKAERDRARNRRVELTITSVE